MSEADVVSLWGELWSEYRPTPLVALPALARSTNVGRVYVKNESERALGNFKSLGGMTAGLRALAAAKRVSVRELLLKRHAPESLPRLICASEGNHGLAVAAAAARVGARASVYLRVEVSAARARRITERGGGIVRIDGTYDDAVAAAAAAAGRGEGILIPDTSADPNDAVVKDVMAGYGVITREIVSQWSASVSSAPLGDGMRASGDGDGAGEGDGDGDGGVGASDPAGGFIAAQERPSHLFVQAGVGGLAAAVAEGLVGFMREPRRVVVVEPAAAPCVARALELGRAERIPGDLQTAAKMLACGLASARAVEILRRHDARSVLVSEDELLHAVTTLLDAAGPHTTASGAAGLAGLLQVAADPALRTTHHLSANSTALFIVTEGMSV
jgi:diaminopropionate ammonia-lyase